MADVVVAVTSSTEIDTIEPDPEIQSVIHSCEPLGPDLELEMMPLKQENPISPIGGGVTPIAEEKETNNNESSPQKEEAEEPKPEEPLNQEEEELLQQEQPVEEESTQQSCPEEPKEKLLNRMLESAEFQAMATLLETTINTATRQLQPVTDKLYEKKYPMVETVLDRLEQASGLKREKIVYGAASFLVVYFLVGNVIQIVCNLVGFLYPAWRSIKAVRSPQKEDDTQWLIYWVVFASLSVLDFSVFSSIPFYWLAKVVFLLYLYLPTFKGANIVYAKYIEPSCTVIESYFTPLEKKEN